MPRAPPNVHLSCPGSVLRSLGQPGTTSYGPATSSAPIAFATAENGAPAAAGSAADGIIRPPSGIPTARPTRSANAIVAVFLMPLLRVSDRPAEPGRYVFVPDARS